MPHRVPRAFAFAAAAALALVGTAASAATGEAAGAAAGEAASSNVAFEAEHEATRQLMTLVRDAAELWQRDPTAACAELKREGTRWRQGDGYVFVLDSEGKALCHPARPSFEGTSLIEIRDHDGKPIVEMFVRELSGERPDGWVHYLWPTPGDATQRWKSTYVRRVDGAAGKRAIVGSGLYNMQLERGFVVDQVDDAAALLARDGKAAFATLRDKASEFRFLDTYVFVFDRAGVQQVNAGFPEVEGQNLLDWKDAEGKVPGRAMLDLLASKDAGWVDYLWPRPGDKRPSRKSTYVRAVTVDGQPMVVGAGLYTE